MMNTSAHSEIPCGYYYPIVPTDSFFCLTCFGSLDSADVLESFRSIS
jgi:hypothetical protein